MRRLPTIRPPDEKTEQKWIIDLAQKLGFEVDSHSQYRASHVSEGVPDLYLTHERLKIDVWFEVKAKKSMHGEAKPLRPDQVTFQERCRRCRILHGWGTFDDFKRFMVPLGLGQFVNGAGFLMRPQGGTAEAANLLRHSIS